MATLFDCTDHTLVSDAIRQSMAALDRGEVIVVPTDTVYGVAVSPRIPGAIDRLVGVKGRERSAPPPILIGSVDQLWPLMASDADTSRVSGLIDRLWPGGLTIVVPVNPELDWDIGDTAGTIAVRMPDEPVLLELLERYGPLAVTSANLTGHAPSEDARAALAVFGKSVSVYLDAGVRGSTNGEQVPSTIIDVTDLTRGGTTFRLIREGVITAVDLGRVLPEAIAR